MDCIAEDPSQLRMNEQSETIQPDIVALKDLRERNGKLCVPVELERLPDVIDMTRERIA